MRHHGLVIGDAEPIMPLCRSARKRVLMLESVNCSLRAGNLGRLACVIRPADSRSCKGLACETYRSDAIAKFDSTGFIDQIMNYEHA